MKKLIFIIRAYWSDGWSFILRFFADVDITALFNEIFGSTLGVDENLLISNLSYGGHSSEILVERKLAQFCMLLVSFNELVWNIVFVINKELNHSNLKRLAFWFVFKIFIVHFNSYVCVVENVVNNVIFCKLEDLVVGFERLLFFLGLLVALRQVVVRYFVCVGNREHSLV